MNSFNPTSTPLRLPLIDWVVLGFYTIFVPLLITGLLSISLIVFSDFINSLLILLLTVSIIFIFLLYIFIYSYLELRNNALKVHYFQFLPSGRDVILVFIKLVYQILFVGLFIVLVFNSLLITQFAPWFYLLISLGLSLIIQAIFASLSNNAKRQLLATALEPVSSDIIQRLNIQKNEQKITEFRFADIQIPSLFLTAGVMPYGMNYACLISRYFKWKLNDDEILAVLAHEMGHITHNHIKVQFLFSGMDGLLRSLRIFGIFFYLVYYSEISATNLLAQFLFIVVIFLTFGATALLEIIKRYRFFLQEIRADNYSKKHVDNKLMAKTLAKIPQTIPAAISPLAQDFLKFRISLLTISFSVEQNEIIP